jgi:phage terminase small subunit
MRLVRAHLLQWQWSDYPAKHRDRTNLWLHIVAVPLFDVATLAVLVGIAVGAGRAAVLALAGMVASLVLEGRGHRREPETPTPFAGPIDFVSRFFVEQWITFPRFVLSGGWTRNLTQSAGSRAVKS